MAPSPIVSASSESRPPSRFPEALARNVYFDARFHRDAVKLMPGEYYYTDADPVLVTVLGSCVAACIRDANSGIGGLNHFMLARSERTTANGHDSMLYGITAMDVLLDQLLEAGAKFEHLEAKVFGGATMLESMVNTDVGERNAEFVLGYLRKRNISLLASDLGGQHARKIYYFPSTGQVLLKRLTELRNDTIVQRERVYDVYAGQVSGGNRGGLK
jgi:chemotaxis protein CheD